jgi:protein TonB
MRQNKRKFIPYLAASFVLHLIAAAFLTLYKTHSPFVSAPIDVSFYSPAGEKSEFQTSAEIIPPKQTKQNIENKTTLPRRAAQENKIPADKEDIEVKNTKDSPQALESQPISRADNLNKSNTQTKSAKRTASSSSQYDGVRFDNADFNYGYYTNSIIRTIGAYWTWTESYGSLRTIVFFRIARDGSISSVEIKKSSGNNRFDLNAVNAVKRAGKFAPLPDGYRHNSLGVYFEFKYRG